MSYGNTDSIECIQTMHYSRGHALLPPAPEQQRHEARRLRGQEATSATGDKGMRLQGNVPFRGVLGPRDGLLGLPGLELPGGSPGLLGLLEPPWRPSEGSWGASGRFGGVLWLLGGS